MSHICHIETKSQAFDVIVSAVTTVWPVTRMEILSDARPEHVVDARQTAMALFLERYRMANLSDTAREFRRKNHTTITSARRQFKNKYETDRNFRQRVDQVKELLNQR